MVMKIITYSIFVVCFFSPPFFSDHSLCQLLICTLLFLPLSWQEVLHAYPQIIVDPLDTGVVRVRLSGDAYNRKTLNRVKKSLPKPQVGVCVCETWVVTMVTQVPSLKRFLTWSNWTFSFFFFFFFFIYNKCYLRCQIFKHILDHHERL